MSGIKELFSEGDQHFATEPGRAIESYEQVLTEVPDHYMAHFNLAMLYSRMGLVELAATHLDQAEAAAHSDMIRDEMRQVFWTAWTGGDSATAVPLVAPRGALPLGAVGYFTADSLAAAATKDGEADKGGGYFCPRCNGNIASVELEQCPHCDAPRPKEPFSWYHDVLLGRTIISGRYKLLRKIDWGGYGVVYHATAVKEDGQPSRAVKLVDAALLVDVEGLGQDLDVLADLDHEGIVKVYAHAHFKKAKKFCTVMELLEGRSVGDRLGTSGPMVPKDAVALVNDVAGALEAAHSANVWHGTLKPTNVFDEGDERVKVLNIGRTDKCDPLQPGVRLPLGPRTAPYAAPEQFDAPGTRGPLIDVYQLGVLLFVALTGRRPYEIGEGEAASSVRDAQALVADTDGPRPSSARGALGMMPELDQLVGRMLATDPARRPQTMTEVRSALAALPAIGPVLEVGDDTNEEPARVTVSIMSRAAQRMREREAGKHLDAAERASEPAEKAQHLLEAGRVMRQRLKDPERAAEILERALDTDPTQLAAFKELTLLHSDAEHWAGLRDAYVRMIARLEKLPRPNLEMVGLLYSKLGEVLRIHLRDRRAAIDAYKTAIAHHPEVVSFRTALADLYAQAADTNLSGLSKAIEQLQAIAVSQPDNVDLLKRLGVLQLRARDFDAALSCFRVLDYLGEGDERASAFVKTHKSGVFEPPPTTISHERFYSAFMGVAPYDAELARVFRYLTPALLPIFSLEPEDWGVRRKDRLDTASEVMFARLYGQMAERLDYPERPAVYHKRDLDGMINGGLDPAGFFVGGSLLAGASEKQVGATVSKMLALFFTPSYLIQLRPQVTDLEAIFYTLAKQVEPSINLVTNESTEKVAATLQRFSATEPEAWKAIEAVMRSILGRENDILLGALQDAYEDAGNRLALFVTGDLHVCRAMLESEAAPIRPERSVDERMRPLLSFSVDPRYHALRREYGLALGA